MAIPKIVNGSLTQTSAATGALLVTPDRNASPPTFSGICTGTLIGCRTFITAAHCACTTNLKGTGNRNASCKARRADQLYVYLQNSGLHAVSSVRINPKFQFGVTGDISIMTLKDPVEGIPLVPINTIGTPAFGTPGTVVGYGWTSGSGGDVGLKRSGKVVTADCRNAGVPQPNNICRQYGTSTGQSAASTCYGDSGGPLYIGQAPQQVLAGVTSGVFNQCEKNSYAFDTNVFENRTFIESNIGGSQTQAARCRADVRKRLKKYVSSVYGASQKCLVGALAGKMPLNDCISKQAAAKVARAQQIFNAAQLSSRCPDEAIANNAFQGECANAATTDQLGQCLIDAGNNAVARMLDVQFADSGASGALSGKPLLKCQTALAGAATRDLYSSLNTLNQCESKIDQHRLPASDCAQQSASSLQRYAESLKKTLLKACSDDRIAALAGANAFGGSCASSTTVAGIADCASYEMADIAQGLSLLSAAETGATPPETCGAVAQVGDTAGGTKVITFTRNQGSLLSSINALLFSATVNDDYRFMTITLNGNQTLLPITSADQVLVDNSLDLYVDYKQTPSVSPPQAAAISNNIGVFEAVKIDQPGQGEWRILVHDAGLATSTPFQLTITLFK